MYNWYAAPTICVGVLSPSVLPNCLGWTVARGGCTIRMNYAFTVENPVIVAPWMLLEYSQEVTTRRRAEETRSQGVTQATLKKLQGVIVLQDEGIVYCPIPKVKKVRRLNQSRSTVDHLL